MTKSVPFHDYEDIWSGLSRFNDILRQSNVENFRRLTDNMAKAIEPSVTAAEIVGRQTKLLSSLNIPNYNQMLVVSAVEKQWSSLACIAAATKTPAIVALQTALIKNDFSAAQTFANSLGKTSIKAPELALIKIAPVFKGVTFSRGIVTAVNGLYVDAAKRLANSENVGFDIADKRFYVENSPKDRATVSETNIICSSLQLLEGIGEDDLISFLTQLEKNHAFASEHETGKRIREIIAQWDENLDFDNDYFYHARALPEGICPYTESQLRRAPEGYTGHGRYNYVGQSHYYFSDIEKGAILEVKKHSRDTRIQIAKLHPKRQIRMIDLSREITSQNKFLEYCRFIPKPEEYRIIKREYLLPCFVADCCKLHGVEGIKYYGSKEYKNYVSWGDEYFDIVTSRIEYIN